MKAVSLRRNSVIYDLDAVYSLGQSRRKYVIMTLLISAISRGFSDSMAIL